MSRRMGGKQKALLTRPIVRCFIQFFPRAKSAGGVRGGGLCQYFDRNLQGGEQGRVGIMHAGLRGVRTEIVKVER